MKEMNRRQEKEGKHSNLDLSSPLRQPFILKYHEESNGSCIAPPSLGYDFITKLYLTGNGDYSQPFLSKNAADAKRKEASGASEDGNGGL